MLHSYIYILIHTIYFPVSYHPNYKNHSEGVIVCVVWWRCATLIYIQRKPWNDSLKPFVTPPPFFFSHTKHTPYCSLEISYLKMTHFFSWNIFCFLLPYCTYLTHAFYCPPPYSLCTKTHTESASSSWSLPPPLYHFTLLSPSPPPDFSRVQHGDSISWHCGGSLCSLRCMRATVLLTDKHRDKKPQSSHITVSYSHSLRGLIW